MKIAYGRVLIGLLAVVLIAGSVGLSSAEALEIAYFDFQEVSTVHPAMREAEQELQEEQARIMGELEEMGEEEQMMQQQMMQQQLEGLQMDLLDEAIEKIEADVEQIAADMDFDYVLDQNVIFAGGEDITEEVIDWVREEYDVEEPEQGLFE